MGSACSGRIQRLGYGAFMRVSWPITEAQGPTADNENKERHGFPPTLYLGKNQTFTVCCLFSSQTKRRKHIHLKVSVSANRLEMHSYMNKSGCLLRNRKVFRHFMRYIIDLQSVM